MFPLRPFFVMVLALAPFLSQLTGIAACSGVDADGDGWSVMDGDCNDTDPAVHPCATEVCNLVDDDCDGTIDDGVPPSLDRRGKLRNNPGSFIDRRGIPWAHLFRTPLPS